MMSHINVLNVQNKCEMRVTYRTLQQDVTSRRVEIHAVQQSTVISTHTHTHRQRHRQINVVNIAERSVII